MAADVRWSIEELLALPYDHEGHALAYRSGRWLKQQLIPLTALPTGAMQYKQGGVYVVLGGAGGLGEVWSRWMIERYAAKIIWLGRRAEDADIQATCSSLTIPPLYL